MDMVTDMGVVTGDVTENVTGNVTGSAVTGAATLTDSTTATATATGVFPTDLYCRALVRFLDALDYDDDNLSHDERVDGLRVVHAATAAYFRAPLARTTLTGVAAARIAAVSRTITHFVVYCWSRVPRAVQIDISIYLSIINVLDDETGVDPSAHMSTFWDDLLQGRRQQHPFWRLMQAHLPRLLAHYGSFCAFNIMRCTFDYFEGCWIEQRRFQGYARADRFPLFLRRLNCLGGAVAGTVFPVARITEAAVFDQLACVMAHVDGPVALVNDLFSFYKEFDQDEPNLVSCWCTVDGISLERTLVRLVDDTVHACVRILDLFRDRDPEIFATLRAFIHGYVTWHFCDLRYRLWEIYDAADDGPVGAKLRLYYEKALAVGWVDLDQWAIPLEDRQLDGSEVDGLGEIRPEESASEVDRPEVEWSKVARLQETRLEVTAPEVKGFREPEVIRLAETEQREIKPEVTGLELDASKVKEPEVDTSRVNGSSVHEKNQQVKGPEVVDPEVGKTDEIEPREIEIEEIGPEITEPRVNESVERGSRAGQKEWPVSRYKRKASLISLS